MGSPPRTLLALGCHVGMADEKAEENLKKIKLPKTWVWGVWRGSGGAWEGWTPRAAGDGVGGLGWRGSRFSGGVLLVLGGDLGVFVREVMGCRGGP